MTLAERFIEHINSSDGKTYLYLSKVDANLDKLRTHVLESCDPVASKTKVALLNCLGFGNLNFSVDVVYVDKGDLSAIAIKAVHPQAEVMWVNPESQELE